MSADFELASGPIHLDNVHCTGNEAFLVNCTASGFFDHDCTHLEDAGVDCEGRYDSSHGKTWCDKFIQLCCVGMHDRVHGIQHA